MVMRISSPSPPLFLFPSGIVQQQPEAKAHNHQLAAGVAKLPNQFSLYYRGEPCPAIFDNGRKNATSENAR